MTIIGFFTNIYMVYWFILQNVTVLVFEVWIKQSKAWKHIPKSANAMWTKLNRPKMRALGPPDNGCEGKWVSRAWNTHTSSLLQISIQIKWTKHFCYPVPNNMSCWGWHVIMKIKCKTIHSSYSSVNLGWGYWSIDKC